MAQMNLTPFEDVLDDFYGKVGTSKRDEHEKKVEDALESSLRLTKTNKIMDSIRKATPAETNKQVDLCVAIANRVFELLKEHNMTQRDFAKALGKTETEVSRWLSGTHNLTLATIAKMASVLGDDIITTTHSPQPYKVPDMEKYAMMVAEEIHT